MPINFSNSKEFNELIKSYSEKMMREHKQVTNIPDIKAQDEYKPITSEEKEKAQDVYEPIIATVSNHSSQSDTMTDSLGRPVVNDTNSLTVGNEGPTVISDIHFVDKLAHFDRERIPERVVHAKGAGAFGYFESYASFGKYTSADFLSEPNKKTDVFVRFSTVIGGRGSADTARDPRGFAVKFYTDDGIYDIVGNNLPVFFIRDAIKFPDVIHSLKPDPISNLKNTERFWDFVSLTPEATHMITWLYSDRGTIKSYRNIDGFGVNTYVWVNKDNVRRFIKYHWRTLQGLKTINRFEAEELAGINPDIAVEDLFNAIKEGNRPKYELSVQIMDPADANFLDFDPLDDTKIWPEDKYPLMKVGVMTLERNPENFFAQVEQSAFCPANIVKGVELSADKMLQGRAFSYHDTQRYRIGTNFAQLPINKSKSPVSNNQRDGAMDYNIIKNSTNYSPNSLNYNKPTPLSSEYKPGPFFEGNLVREPINKTDDFSQAGEHYRSLSPEEQDALVDNIAVELYTARIDIIDRVITYFEDADQEFAIRVTQAMEMYKNRD